MEETGEGLVNTFGTFRGGPRDKRMIVLWLQNIHGQYIVSISG